MTEGELRALWIAAGGDPAQSAMAAQVALLESEGTPTARNLSSREDSRGLWQINTRAHPRWASRDLYDPRENVRAAIAISGNGRDWSPWTTAAAARAKLGVMPAGPAAGGCLLALLWPAALIAGVLELL